MEYLEVTTQIGCRVACLKYCPQELITSKYSGERTLSKKAFEAYINTVPPNVTIWFGGVSEPFQNPECIDMILYAYAKGHTIRVSSTLVGMPIEDARILAKLPIDLFVLHLPDADGVAKINITPEYLEVLGIILGGVKNLQFMNMGYGFVTNKCEEMARGTTDVHKIGRVMCEYMETPSYQLMPNGDVYFCCMVRGLTERVSSLSRNTYGHLVSLHPSQSLRLQCDESSICHRCVASQNYKKYWLYKTKNRIFGERPLISYIF